MQFDNSSIDKGEDRNLDSLLEIRFKFFDTTDVNHPSYFFEKIDPLRLEYTTVEKEWIEG